MKQLKLLTLVFASFSGAMPAEAAPWLVQRQDALINWSQLTLEFSKNSEESGTAAIGESSANAAFKGKELATWQNGSNYLRQTLAQMRDKGPLDSSRLPSLKDPNKLRPNSTRTIYYTNGGIQVNFRFDLRDWGTSLNPPEGDGASLDPGTLVIRLPKNIEPALAYDLCPEGQDPILAKNISPKAWADRLGGRWFKGSAKASDADKTLEIRALSMTPPGCIAVEKTEDLARLQRLYQSGQVHWVQEI